MSTTLLDEPTMRLKPGLARLLAERRAESARRQAYLQAEIQRAPYSSRWGLQRRAARVFGVTPATIARDLKRLAALAEAS